MLQIFGSKGCTSIKVGEWELGELQLILPCFTDIRNITIDIAFIPNETVCCFRKIFLIISLQAPKNRQLQCECSMTQCPTHSDIILFACLDDSGENG